MSARDMFNMIGQEYAITLGTFTIKVLVDDVRQAYGRWDAYVAPVGGSGWAWVAIDRLKEWEG